MVYNSGGNWSATRAVIRPGELPPEYRPITARPLELGTWFWKTVMWSLPAGPWFKLRAAAGGVRSLSLLPVGPKPRFASNSKTTAQRHGGLDPPDGTKSRSAHSDSWTWAAWVGFAPRRSSPVSSHLGHSRLSRSHFGQSHLSQSLAPLQEVLKHLGHEAAVPRPSKACHRVRLQTPQSVRYHWQLQRNTAHGWHKGIGRCHGTLGMHGYCAGSSSVCNYGGYARSTQWHDEHTSTCSAALSKPCCPTARGQIWSRTCSHSR
jgi:hypothetical protein